MPESLPHITDDQILAARSPKQPLDPQRPVAYLVEAERGRDGAIEDVATLFLTNRECPYRCLMCDLWKATLDVRVPPGAIPAQIEFALARLPPARHIKLYNSGNFFDRQAIPREDHPRIADLVRSFRTVIVENHPRLCGDPCRQFADRLAGRLEIAIGLETVHPGILPRLNKHMTLDDFARATERLLGDGLSVRAFILLRPPFLDGPAGVEWALRSIEFAFRIGVECCSVIPTRAGNGIMEQLAAQGHFTPPSLADLEQVLAEGLAHGGGRVFVDLWEIEQLTACPQCGPARRHRLAQMNLSQQILPLPLCSSCS